MSRKVFVRLLLFAYQGDYLNKITFLKKLDSIVGPLCARALPALSSGNQSSLIVQKVLFIRPGGIGDAVLLIPTIQALKINYPQATIEVLAEKRNGAVFDLAPEVKQVFCYDHWSDWRQLLTRRYDIIIDSEQWHYLSAIIARLIRSKKKIGFGTNDRRRLLTDVVSYRQDKYEQQTFLDLLSPLGLKPESMGLAPFLQIPAAIREKTSELLSELQNCSFVVLFPGASIAERRWKIEYFAELATRISTRGYGVILVGGSEDCEAGQRIAEADSTIIDLTGKTSLMVTAAILRRSILLVSGDSGVLHLGVGLDRATVSLFGPGISAKWAPQGEHHRVINHHLPCSPCTRFGTTPLCPIAGRCIQDISVDEVFSAVASLLPQKGA